jgi:hypothetical protein
VKRDIDYAIVALDLAEAEVVHIIKEATGLTVDANARKFLKKLNGSQLEAVWKRLSRDPRWKKRDY